MYFDLKFLFLFYRNFLMTMAWCGLANVNH